MIAVEISIMLLEVKKLKNKKMLSLNLNKARTHRTINILKHIKLCQ